MTPAAVLPRGFQGLHTCGVTGIRVCRDARQKRPVFLLASIHCSATLPTISQAVISQAFGSALHFVPVRYQPLGDVQGVPAHTFIARP